MNSAGEHFKHFQWDNDDYNEALIKWPITQRYNPAKVILNKSSTTLTELKKSLFYAWKMLNQLRLDDWFRLMFVY